MKTVFIAEKPDIASAIASFMGKRLKKGAHAYTGTTSFGDTVVTWAYGHIMMTAMPGAYGKEYESFAKYPIFPESWKKLPSPKTKEQFDFIKKVLKTADVVVNAGDPDREGQLLIDEILDFVGYRGETRRILINAKDNDSLQRAFDGITANSRFRPLYLAGLARERADWLVGMNLSRAYTVNAKHNGRGNVWRIGRVKVPTLALVVNREKEIQNFMPVNYYMLGGEFCKDGTDFNATLVIAENYPTDSEGRIVDRSLVADILSIIEGKPARVILSDKKEKSESAPLPYSLDTLQVEANRRYGMSPSSVLEKVQSLYEKKLVSYPRSDCNYIPVSQHCDGNRILDMLSKCGFAIARNADSGIMSRCFNDKKVSAHHAIIPTGVAPNDMESWEKKVYDMIALRYIIQFFPVCRYNTINFVLDSEGYQFEGSGKSIVVPGWRSVYIADEEEEEGSKMIPSLSIGDIIEGGRFTISEKSTTPPKRFTEGTLLAAMTNIWRFVSKDNPNRDRLKECKGIGTPATRDTIISELMAAKADKSHGACIEKHGKELVPTDFGMSMIENLHESLTKPDSTAIMEYNLSAIAEGRMTLEEFMNQTVSMVEENIRYAESTAESLSAVASASDEGKDDGVPNEECPICHSLSLKRQYSPKTRKHFWVCEDKGCVHPEMGKQVFYDELRKKPLVKKCPQCGLPLSRVYSKKTKSFYWFCQGCNEFKKLV